MKRFISALAFCVSLLVLLSLFLFPTVKAKENVLSKLLSLPAPPPPNPLARGAMRDRDQKFYDKNNPPKDNAPIDELLDYWRQQSSTSQRLRYNPEPSEKVLARIMDEIGKNPKLVTSYLGILGRDAGGADFVKGIYDREGDSFDKNERRTLKGWLTYNSPYFSNDLATAASGVSDTGEYVSNQEELLALAHVDFDKARRIIDRLNADGSSKTSRVLAKWALYKHALDTDSIGDIEQYRDDLKAIVEDKSAIPGMRDLAMDALVSEKEWSGRDDWYFSLLGDETLADLQVNGQSYTGLTTLMLVSPDEKYVDKMLELSRSDNRVVRSAAVRNLVTRLENGGPEVLKALLPWLEDPKWAVDSGDSRGVLVRKLGDYQIPDSVPGLVRVLDEKQTQSNPIYGANMAMNVARPPLPSANANRPSANFAPTYGPPITFYPYRYSAVTALAKQKDGSAVPPLRRVLSEVDGYERGGVVKAILECGGFSVEEQIDALESTAKGERSETSSWGANAVPPATSANSALQRQPATAAEIKYLLGQQLSQASEITDLLARAIVDRIEALDEKDPKLAGAYRSMILKWQNPVINILLLRDVKRDAANADTIVRLLSQRKELRERQASDVFDLRTGKSTAVGISACLLDDVPEYASILENGDAETKTAMLACARLIRAPLPIEKVGDNLKAPAEILQLAAERYLESEDSPAARTMVLARHQNEARILGATTAFFVDGVAEEYSEYLWMLYQSVGDNSLYNGWSGSGNDEDLKAIEKSLQAEVKKDLDLIGVYAYDRNYIRIYKDRVIFSWDEDDSRYRERPLTKYEFDEIKSYLTTNKVDELPPFLSCGGAYCNAKELLTLGRGGGRRVYMNGGEIAGVNSVSDFFAGLDKYFADLKQTRATLKYTLSREIPGLEILLASDDLHAETVWKEGPDLRVAASDRAVRKKIKNEIENTDPEGGLTSEDGIVNENEGKDPGLAEERRYEGVAWYKVSDGDVAGVTAQPPGVGFIPVRDALAVQPTEEQWKARSGAVEIRSSEDGLFKVFGGKLTKIRSGYYQYPVITPNGRWIIALRSDAEGGENVVRVDLLTNREYPVAIQGYGQSYPVAYLPTLDKILIIHNDRYYESEEGYQPEGDEDVAADDAEPSLMLLVNPATGVTGPIAGEVRPLSQQTFRPLQKTSKPNEFWAAIYDSEKNETQVGVYDTRFFGFRPMLRIPKMKFNSMSMWVDDVGGKVYFVYRGHLLALPLAK